MSQATNAPGLSAFVTKLNEAWRDELFAEFLRAFTKAHVGVIVVQAPEGASGVVVSTRAQPIALGNSTHGDGKRRILAFADPQQFREKYGEKFNGEMVGLEVLNTAWSDQACEGVLVNGATSLQSVAIDREAVRWALAATKASSTPRQKKPWWRFW
jgi:hypothetical protein